MRNLKTSLMVGSLMASAAFAELIVDIPAPATTLKTLNQVGADSTSDGALAIKQLSGATYYVGHASTAQLSETTLGELSLSYSLTFDAKDGNYGTAVGILLPLTAAWDIKDLTNMTSITYQAKAATAGVKVHMIIGSDAYGADMAKENSAITSNATALKTSYSTVTVIPTELVTPTWAKAESAATTGWVADGEIYTTGIAPFVKDLNIQPVLNWASATSLTSDAASVNTITIKDVKIAGVNAYGVPHGVNCNGKSFVVDDFATSDTRSAGDANYLGNYWYAFTDTTSDADRNNTDTATGFSKVLLPAKTRAWKWTPLFGAFLDAELNKFDSASTVDGFKYHKYAGWADIGTDLTDNAKNPMDFTSFSSGDQLTAISFDLYAGASAAPALAGAVFDTNLVKRITVKVGSSGAPDAAPFQIDIASDSAVIGWDGQNTGLTNLCVDLSALTQPGWYVKNNLNGNKAELSPSALTKLSWEAKIEDQKDPTKALARVTFGVGNVTLWGIDATDMAEIMVSGVKGAKARGAALKVAYGANLVLSYSLPGTSAQIEVLRLDGSKVASFKAAATAQNLSLPVSLTRGNYLVTVAGNSKRLASTLAVAR